MILQARIIDEAGRAIGADRFVVRSHVDIDMRVIERWQSADTLEFLDGDLDGRVTGLIVKMSCCVVRHFILSSVPVPSAGNLAQRHLDW